MSTPLKALAHVLIVTVSIASTTTFAQNLSTASVSGGTHAAESIVGENPSPGATAIRPLAAANSDILTPGALPVAIAKPALPRVFAPTSPRDIYTRFPWKRNIVTTVFWVGELPTQNNPTPNTVSAWDMRWTSNYGGYDNPKRSARDGYIPKGFTPGQNPFYFALPYNDITRTGTKASARAMIPWFKKSFYRSGRTVLKGRWIAIRREGKICYAQWEDVGPFETDDWKYVFGDSRPKTRKNKGAGLDISPAVRDYLGIPSGYGTVDWRFVDIDEVPDGPWKNWGANNPFANSGLTENGTDSASESILKVRELRDRLIALGDTEVDEGTEARVE